MGEVRGMIKEVLMSAHLFSTAHKIWDHRPDIHMMEWNAGYRLAGSLDHLPIPPTRLIYLVTNSREVAWFLTGGRICYQSILHAIEKNGMHMQDFKQVLDFGCGAGRVMRYWNAHRGPHYWGTDYNPQLIRWCQKNLARVANFKVNGLIPPLDFQDGAFDFIYSISVFTHLTDELQHVWIQELARVLAPGGILLLTVHGESREWQMTPEELRLFREGKLVVKDEKSAGTNICGAFESKEYVQRELMPGFDLVDFIEEGVRDADQDIYLFRKQARQALL